MTSGTSNSGNYGLPNPNAYVKIKSGNTNDTVMGTSNYGTLDIGTGGGNDTTTITGIGGFAYLDSAAGDDTNYIFNMFTKNHVNAGSGNDKTVLGGSYNNSVVNCGKGNDIVYVTGPQSQGNVNTIYGGQGFDTVVLEGAPQNYVQGMIVENGQMYRTFTDANGNVTRVANDVENIQYSQPNAPQPYPQPYPQQPQYPQYPQQPAVQPPPPPPPQQGAQPVGAPQYGYPPAGGNYPNTGNVLQDLANWFYSFVAAITNPPQPVAANETGTITGDPHFKGGDGDTYDVQGQPGKTYNLLSDKGLQYNGTFQSWGNGGATVVGESAINVQGQYGQSSVTFDKTGKATVNGQVLQDGQTVQLADGGTATKQGNKLIVKTAEGYTITQTAQDGYINSEVKTGANGVGTDGVLPGGLLGQTFDPDKQAKHGAKGAGAQGEGAITGKVQDYEVPGLITPPPQPQPQPYPYPPIPPMPPPPPPSNPVDRQLDQMELVDLVGKAGGQDGKMTAAELERAMNDPYSGLSPDQRALGAELLKTMKTMEGSKVFDPAGVTAQQLMQMAGSDGNAQSLSFNDLAKNNGVWNTRPTNNDGQLGTNEVFANNGNGQFNNAGFVGYFSKGDGVISEADLKDRLAHGTISQDERQVGEALLKLIEAKKAAGQGNSVSAQELQQIMGADGNMNNLTAGDIQAATARINPDPRVGERNLVNYMRQNFAQIDQNHDGFISPAEIQQAGNQSGNPQAAQTFIQNLNQGPYGKGLIFESIDPGAAAWGGVSMNDLNEISAEQNMGKSLYQIASEQF